MNPNLCVHEDGSTSRMPMYGSRLMLCRICWAVIDPSPRPPRPRAPTSARQEIPVVKPILTELVPLKPPVPALMATTVVDEAFEVPPYRRRLMTAAFLPRLKYYVSALIILPFAIFGILHYLTYFPSFEEYTDPSKQYTVLFPDEPIWAGGRAGGSDGEVTRHFLGSPEVYRVHVSQLHQLSLDQIKNVNALLLAEFLAKLKGHEVIRPRKDVYFANAAVEYQRRINGRDMIVGRIIVVNELVYELTIIGPHLSLGDWRAQTFFNSFRVETPVRADFNSQPVLPNTPVTEQQRSALDSRKDE